MKLTRFTRRSHQVSAVAQLCAIALFYYLAMPFLAGWSAFWFGYSAAALVKDARRRDRERKTNSIEA